MDKKIALSKYQSNPQVKKILEFVREDKNWIYDLFDLVQIRVRHFLKLSYFQNINLENDLTLIIFGNVLLSIVESESDKYLTIIYPIRRKFESEAEKKAQKGGDIAGYMPFTPYDSRRLVKNSVNMLINKYLSISGVFVHYMKDNESYVRAEYLSLFKEKEKLNHDLKTLYSRFDFLTSKTQKNNLTKSNVGNKPLYNTKEEFLEALKIVPLEDRKSYRKIGKCLNNSHNTVKKYLKIFSIDISKL